MSDHTTPAPSSEQVEYRDAPGLPGYRVGDDGSVWSCHLGMGRKGLGVAWRRLKPGRQTSGHLFVALRLAGRYVTRRVHQLVLLAFVGPRPEGMQCRHLDGDPTNNQLENLRWGTPLENHADSVRHGTISRGERHPAAKLTRDAVLAIRRLRRSGWQCPAIARLCGVGAGAIHLIVTRKRWAWLPEEQSS